MNYRFYILCDTGITQADVSSDVDFSCAPFGFARYRTASTCNCEPIIISEFWRCVDDVLVANDKTSNNFIRAIGAVDINNKTYGESICQ